MDFDEIVHRIMGLVLIVIMPIMAFALVLFCIICIGLMLSNKTCIPTSKIILIDERTNQCPK